MIIYYKYVSIIKGENTFCALMHKNNTNAKLILNLRRLEHAYRIVYLLLHDGHTKIAPNQKKIISFNIC
jgi:hypothetical protein